MQKDIKVSVSMITYGHEKFIEEAINGVLMQEGNFELELIISNDCSPDKTDDIVQKILKNHPKASLIKYFKHKKNIGIMPNYYYVLEQCTGDFVATCDGDDYWTDKLKIQKQLNVLYNNDKIQVVYSNVRLLIQNSGKFVDNPLKYTNRNNQVKAMLESKYIESVTTLFRKNFLFEISYSLKEEMIDKVIGDTRIFLEAAHRSEIGYINDVTAVYRINDGSASQQINLDKFIFATLDSYNCRKSFVLRYGYPKKYLSSSLVNIFKSFVRTAYSEKEYSKSLKILSKIPYFDFIRFVKFEHLFQKITPTYYVKFGLTLIGIKNGS